MPHSLIKTFATFGLEGYEVTIEADVNKALPTIEIIWLPDAAVKESKERIRATFRNLDIPLPAKKIVLNLAPSDIKKTWTWFDLPMAVAILFLMHENIFHQELLPQSLFFGELWLDGSVRKVQWLLPAVISAKKKWYSRFFVPRANIYELRYIPDIHVCPLESFRELVDYFVERKEIVFEEPLLTMPVETFTSSVDFSAIKGHLLAKRALSIAAAWTHNFLMVWPPGSGKTLLAKAIASILPPLSFDEMVELSQIYSLVGKLTETRPLITSRPFRWVHHTASKVSIVWGGAQLHPGEITLAHKWVLFFDELPEFPREVLEVLRQPIENKEITISRAIGSVNYPADSMFVAAMNPCKCGYYKDLHKQCLCSLQEVARYQSKVSWPLLDRLDMILEIPREDIETIFEKTKPESSESLREKVLIARELQQRRYRGTDISSNSRLKAHEIDRYIRLDEQSEIFLKQAADKLVLSGRTIHRALKLSRTIADFEQKENVLLEHVAEALQYRSKTMFVEQ